MLAERRIFSNIKFALFLANRASAQLPCFIINFIIFFYNESYPLNVEQYSKAKQLSKKERFGDYSQALFYVFV